MLQSGILKENNTISPVTLLELNKCNEPPCLFGESIAHAHIDDVRDILESSPLVESESLWRYDSELYWSWSVLGGGVPGIAHSTPIQEIAYEPSPYQFNSVYFRDDGATAVYMDISMRLEQLIYEVGTPIYLIPWFYDRWGNMYTLIAFGEYSGYFVLSTECEAPEISPTSHITTHISIKEDQVSKLNLIKWEDHAEVPTCGEVFVP